MISLYASSASANFRASRASLPLSSNSSARSETFERVGRAVPVVRDGGFAPAAGLAALFFDSGFLALKMPAPAPTSAPTSCANAIAPATTVKQRAAELRISARTTALMLMITLLGLQKKNLWITEELLRWIVDQLSPDDLIVFIRAPSWSGLIQPVQGLRTSRNPISVLFVEAGTKSRRQDDTGLSAFVGSL